MSRGRVEPEFEPDGEDPGPKDMAYYFAGPQLKAMRKLKPYELWHRLAAAYQLAGGLLIGAKVLDTDGSRNINGWTDEEVDDAIEQLLDFLWCPADVTAETLEQTSAVYRAKETTE